MGKTKLDIIKNFDKLFNVEGYHEGGSNDIPKKQRKGYLDPANISMVIPKLNSVKKLLVECYDVGEGTKIPSLDYHSKEGELCKSKYSKDFLKTLLTITLKSQSDSISFELRKNYPLRIECKELIFILAPRVEGE